MLKEGPQAPRPETGRGRQQCISIYTYMSLCEPACNHMENVTDHLVSPSTLPLSSKGVGMVKCGSAIRVVPC